ncbi:MAG: hypothetical protein ACOH2J_11770 [Allorhizobium sp.]
MNRKIAALIGATIGIAAIAAPAAAEQSALSLIVFGKIYNDNVTAIDIGSQSQRDGISMPASLLYPNKARESTAQAEAGQDPMLKAALAVRAIAVKNVIFVQTAANGNKIIYYR